MNDESSKNKVDDVIASVALNADAVLLRQSALTVLGDAVTAAGWSCIPLLNDVIDIALGILLLEIKSRQEDRAARRLSKYLQPSKYIYILICVICFNNA